MNFLNRFMYVRDPDDQSFWMKVRRAVAGWIYPGLHDKTRHWYRDFFSHEYMRSTHEHYSRQSAQLNRAISKKSKRIRQLEKELAALKLKA